MSRHVTPGTKTHSGQVLEMGPGLNLGQPTQTYHGIQEENGTSVSRSLKATLTPTPIIYWTPLRLTRIVE